MLWVSVSISILVIIVDRWLKLLAQSGVEAQFGFAKFVLFKNDALVFSWPAPNSIAILLMMVAMVVVGIVGYRRVQQKNVIAWVGCCCILVGALSNLFDRIAYGYVIDWAYLGTWWPVFNIADTLIGLGVILLLWPRRLTVQR